ncbi:MAG: DUF421 domain-containing protein [Phycisphaerae bacterium]|nr:DUF421 domain-containing protein [Phycisphaerae bacterium]
MVWLVFRISGRRTFAEMNTFDLVLVLIVSEATQQALIGDDKTISGATVVVATLAFIDVAALRITSRSKVLDRFVDGVPALLVHDGRPLTRRMRRLRVSLDDILESARREQGVQGLERIRLAVLERDGSISIVTRDEPPPETPGEPSDERAKRRLDASVEP